MKSAPFEPVARNRRPGPRARHCLLCGCRGQRRLAAGGCAGLGRQPAFLFPAPLLRPQRRGRPLSKPPRAPGPDPARRRPGKRAPRRRGERPRHRRRRRGGGNRRARTGAAPRPLRPFAAAALGRFARQNSPPQTQRPRTRPRPPSRQPEHLHRSSSKAKPNCCSATCRALPWPAVPVA